MFEWFSFIWLWPNNIKQSLAWKQNSVSDSRPPWNNRVVGEVLLTEGDRSVLGEDPASFLADVRTSSSFTRHAHACSITYFHHHSTFSFVRSVGVCSLSLRWVGGVGGGWGRRGERSVKPLSFVLVALWSRENTSRMAS